MYFDGEKDRHLEKNVVVRTVFPPNSYTEVLIPSTQECDCIQRSSL